MNYHRHAPHQAVVCSECGGVARVQPGSKVYPKRKDLAHKMFWVCPYCGARVGCHRGSLAPLGTPALADTREARKAAHDAFDPLWRAKMRREGISRDLARGQAYCWLAEQLGLEPEACHIGMMDKATARKVVDICRATRRAA